MDPYLFSLNFNHLEVFLLSIIPALINVGIFIYAVLFLSQNKTNKAFFLFVLCLGIAQIVDGFMRMSVSQQTAMMWCRMSSSPFVFAVSFGLLFTLRFTSWDKKIKDSLVIVLLFLPPILLQLLMFAQLDKYVVIKSDRWNWIANPVSTITTDLIYLWLTLIGLLIFTFLWLYFFNSKTSIQKKQQTLLLAIGFTIPFFGGVTTEVVFPFVFHFDSIPLSTPLITAFSIASLIAIKQYNMLDYSPKHQGGNIIENMNEGIFIVDNDCRIMFANKIFCEMVQYKVEEIEGKVMHSFFVNEEEPKNGIEIVNEECKNKKIGSKEIQLITKRGENMWVLIIRSPYRDTNGNVIGSILMLSDITERKKAKVNLLESEERLRNFIQNSLLSIYFFDVKTKKIIYANPAFYALTGYLPEELESLTIYDFVNHSTENIDTFVNQTIQLKQHEVGEREWKRKDGKVIQVYVNASFIINSSNSEIIYISGQDITQSKQAEAKLLTSDNILKETRKISKIGSYVLDISNGKWKGCEEMERIFGLSASDEHSIEDWLSIIHPENKKLMIDYFEHEVIGNKVRFDKKYKIINQTTGEEHWVNGIGELELDDSGTPIKMMGTIQDITERKKLEEEMIDSENKFKSVIQSAKDSIILANETGVIIFWNYCAEKMFGYKEKEVLGKPLSFIMPERYRNSHVQRFKEHVSSNEDKVMNNTIELNGLRKNGNEFPIELSLSYWVSQKRKFYCGIIRDNTERKKAEEKQSEYIKKLSEIAFMQSHHVRAPIASILGLLDLVNFEKPEDPKNIEVFYQLKRTSLMCDNVIKEIISKSGELEK